MRRWQLHWERWQTVTGRACRSGNAGRVRPSSPIIVSGAAVIACRFAELSGYPGPIRSSLRSFSSGPFLPVQAGSGGDHGRGRGRGPLQSQQASRRVSPAPAPHARTAASPCSRWLQQSQRMKASGTWLAHRKVSVSQYYSPIDSAAWIGCAMHPVSHAFFVTFCFRRPLQALQASVLKDYDGWIGCVSVQSMAVDFAGRDRSRPAPSWSPKRP